MSRLEQKKRERENKATMEADMQQALAEKEVIAKQVSGVCMVEVPMRSQ